MNNYKIKIQNNSSIWDKFILNSASPNIFNHSIFLNSYEIEKYFIYNNEEIFGAFSINRNKNNKIILPTDLLYTPLVYKTFHNKPYASILSEKFTIIKTVLDYLSNEANDVEISFDYHTDDLRPFFWYNFDRKKEIFSISNIKYTSIVNLNKIDLENFELSEFFKDMSVRTRQSYRYSLSRKKYSLKEHFEIDLIKNFIKKTFRRQKININFDLDTHMEILKKLYKKNLIKSFCCIEKNSIKSIAVFGVNDNFATFINGARSDELSEDYSLVYLLLKSFLELKKIGLDYVDLEGMNSPQRSFFKSGFGGELKPYYTIRSKKF